jgi:hypothetical protein
VILVLASIASAAQAQIGAVVSNWAVPSSGFRSGSSSSSSSGLHHSRTLADVTYPLPFIGVTPCRIVDTRGPAGPFGAPSLAASTPRNFALPGGPCAGIPSNVSAYSLNITVTNTLGPGFISIYPQGGPAPLVSTLNYNAAQTLANAAIVPAGTGGGVTVVAGVSGTDLIVDINGYYGSTPGNQQNYFQVNNSSTGYTIVGTNSSTSCSGPCGIIGQVSSGTAVEGISLTGGDGVYGKSVDASGAGVHGVLNLDVSSSIAVYGEHLSTGGGGIGVYGSQAGNGYGVLGRSLGATGSGAIGVYGSAASNSGGAIGVLGSEFATTGAVYGVEGTISSSDILAAGVFGVTNNPVSNAGRFLGNGVNTYLGFQTGGVDYALSTAGRILGGSLVITGAPKSFASPHPENPALEIRYACVEAPTVDVYFRGTADLVNGYARIEIPDHFRFTAKENTYMTTLTAVGRPVGLTVESEGPDGIRVRGSGSGRFHYVVYAERAETEGFQPVQPNVTFTPEMLEKVLLKGLPATTKALLVKSKILNPDGSYNTDTAREQGWTIPAPSSSEAVTPRSQQQ